MKISIFVALVFASVAYCSLGVDISSAVSTSDFQCLVKQGYTFAIPRCFQSTGHVDTECASNAANARAAGMDVDLYFFPCFKCGNAFAQMSNFSSYVKSNGVKYHTLWLDIEGTQYWGTQTANQAFFKQLISAGESLGITMGVYTSESQWTPIMGDYTYGSSYILWYAHYDNQKSFTDFVAFGGWKTPTMKQYQGDVTVCGVGVDENWMPGGNSTTGPSTVATSTHATVATHTTTDSTHTTVATHATSDSTHATATHATSDSTHATATHSTSDTSQTSQTQTTYSSGGDGTGFAGSMFDQSPGSIYNAKLGGNKLPLTSKAQEKVEALQRLKIRVTQVEDVMEKDSHFKVMEEKVGNKFSNEV